MKGECSLELLPKSLLVCTKLMTPAVAQLCQLFDTLEQHKALLGRRTRMLPFLSQTSYFMKTWHRESKRMETVIFDADPCWQKTSFLFLEKENIFLTIICFRSLDTTMAPSSCEIRTSSWWIKIFSTISRLEAAAMTSRRCSVTWKWVDWQETWTMSLKLFLLQFVCMGGTPKRMENFAHFIMDEIGYKLPAGTQLQDISAFSYRYSMYKVGR